MINSTRILLISISVLLSVSLFVNILWQKYSTQDVERPNPMYKDSATAIYRSSSQLANNKNVPRSEQLDKNTDASQSQEVDVDQDELQSESLKQAQPNIIFILADDYGYHDIGYHGSQYGGKMKTPVLDKLAAEGVTLENYYVQPICTPTRSQLMSGRYQIHMGMQHSHIDHDEPRCLPLDETTLPQKLSEAGYSTHMVGKWHLGYYKADCLPHRRGFESFFGLYLGGGMHYAHTAHYGKCKTDGTRGYDLHENEFIADPKIWKGQYSTTIFTDRAISIIKNQSLDKPLFLYVAFQAVHDAMEAPDEYIAKFKHISDNTRRIYGAMVNYMDYSVGRLVDALKEKGIWNNTVLVFSTDNGGNIREGNNWPLRGRKNTLWEGGVRGIGFVNSPLIPPASRGRISRDLIHITDWFPTFVKGLAGGSVAGTKPLDGYDVWDTIRLQKPSPRKEILHNIDPYGSANTKTVFANKPHLFQPNVDAAIRVGDWKLITSPHATGGEEWHIPVELKSTLKPPEADTSQKTFWLFNIKEDPLEIHDLSPLYPDKVEELLQRLQYHNQTSVPVFYPPCDKNSQPANHNGFFIPWAEENWKHFTEIAT